MPPARHAARGFTLIEALTALSVVAIGLGLGLPALGSAMERTRSATTYHLLTASLMSARSTAITRQKHITLCPSRDGVACRDDLTWEEGWIVFVDSEKTGVPKDASSILNRVESLGTRIAVRSTPGRHRVRYQPNGRALGSNISLWLCSQQARTLLGRVVVSGTGRTRTERADDGRQACPRPI